MNAKFVHTNLVAKNLYILTSFYIKVFGCKQVVSEQNYSDKWVADSTGVPDAAIKVVHLRLPGHGDNGPTLEIIQYDKQLERQRTAANRPGFGHIAFAVDDVEAARDAVIAAGGGPVGDIVTVDLPGRGKLTEVYVADPEGNIIELQKWQ